MAFGVGHLVSTVAAGIDTTVRLGDFVDSWDPGAESLGDQLIPVPAHLLVEVGHHPSLRVRTVKGQLAWYVPVEGARTRIQKAEEHAKGRRLTRQEKVLLNEELERIETAFAEVGHVQPDTTPEEDTHLRWTFLRLAPMHLGGEPLGVWQIALAEKAREKTIRNETVKLRKHLGIERFPKAPRKPEYGPRSKLSY